MEKEWYCLLGLYLLAANLAAFFLMGMDKRRARRGKHRVPERTLFLPVVLGGALGGTLLGIFGNEDFSPTSADVDKLEVVLRELGKDYEFHRYDGAGHGMWYYDKPMYRQEQAMDSWNKCIAFLDKHLK